VCESSGQPPTIACVSRKCDSGAETVRTHMCTPSSQWSQKSIRSSFSADSHTAHDLHSMHVHVSFALQWSHNRSSNCKQFLCPAKCVTHRGTFSLRVCGEGHQHNTTQHNKEPCDENPPLLPHKWHVSSLGASSSKQQNEQYLHDGALDSKKVNMNMKRVSRLALCTYAQ
jgi:hypothetical protein